MDRVQLSWHNITYKNRNKSKHKEKYSIILDNVSGFAVSGELNALLGHTGAGKTTLMTILTGRIKLNKADVLEGTIRNAGQLRDQNWRHLISFSEQNAHFFKELTTDEILQFQADLKLGNQFTYAEKRFIIDYLIHRLDLHNIRFKKIGTSIKRGLSAGEMKLISIACLILEMRPLAIMDEPTSELDSSRSLILIDFLKEFCERTGMTVLMTIHQPRKEIWEKFSTVSVMSKSRTLFHGSPTNAKIYFEEKFALKFHVEANPPDKILDFIKIKNLEGTHDHLVSAWSAQQISTQFHRIPACTETSTSKNDYSLTSNLKNSYWREFCILHHRYALLFYRDRYTLTADAVQTILLCLLISFAYFQIGREVDDVNNIISLVYFISVSLLATVGMPLWTIFSSDRPILIRERASCTYRVSTSYFAKLIAVLPVSIFLMIVFIIPVYYIAGLQSEFDKFLTYFAILLSLRLAAITLGLMISALSKSIYISLILGPFLIVIFVLLGGLKAEKDEITWILLWIRYLSPPFYSCQALIQNEFVGDEFQLDTDTSQLIGGEYYLEQYNFDQIGIWFCFIALMGFAVLYCIIGYVAMRITTKTRQVLI